MDLLDSAVLEHGQVCRGCRFATSCSGQICSATKTCSWNPVQIGVARQPLASEFWGGLTSALGCFQPEGLECWTLACCSQQVGNLQHGQAASLKCWICLTVQGWSLVKLAGVADLQHFALVFCNQDPVQIQHGQVGRSGQICFAFKTCSWSILV